MVQKLVRPKNGVLVNFIKMLERKGHFDDKEKERENVYEMVTSPDLHRKMRNELMTVVYPIRVNTDGPHQSASWESVINRVINTNFR